VNLANDHCPLQKEVKFKSCKLPMTWVTQHKKFVCTGAGKFRNSAVDNDTVNNSSSFSVDEFGETTRQSQL
jgi:hypothetical protein